MHSFFAVGLEALISARRRRVKIIGTNHWTIEGFAPYLPINAGLASAYVRWFYDRCDFVTAPSRAVLEELGARGPTPRARVVANPIDTDLFAPVDPERRHALKQRFGLTRPTVVYAGRLGAEKNIDVLIHAIAKLNGPGTSGLAPDLAIAGHGAHEPALRGLAGTLGVTERVRFLGTLCHADLADLLRCGDVFAIMSTTETQSMVMTQAMACGVPVVAAASRALPEYVDRACGILVEPHDADALAHAMDELIAAPDRRHEMGLAGRRAAMRCAVETITDAWEHLYDTVIHGGQSR